MYRQPRSHLLKANLTLVANNCCWLPFLLEVLVLYSYLKMLKRAETQLLSRMLRVDHAGEVGANYIYRGQLAVRNDPLIAHMLSQEEKHLFVMEKLMENCRIRPSLFAPLWKVAGYTLGVGTALMGPKSAMACTEAVETVIGGHYNDQIRDLIHTKNPDHAKLIEVLKEFRDDELEHKAEALKNESEKAPLHRLMTSIIRGGCTVAIKVAERI